MKILLRTGILGLILLWFFPSAVAQDFCPGFGVNGMATSLESHATHLNALTVLPDGKIIAVGYYDNSGDKDMLVARYHANGTPDLTFSGNGIRTYQVSDHGEDEALCVQVASDGNILVGGISAGYGSIIKLNTSGGLVSSFGTGGKVTYDILYSSVEDIMVSSQGNIYGVGKTFDTENIVLRRLNVQAYDNDGALLDAFSGDGKYDRNDFLLWHTTTVRGELQSDGKIVVGGTTPGSGNLFDNWFLVRLNTDGSPDNAFHADGLVEDPEVVTSRLKDLAIGSDGSIYIGGYNNLDSDFPTLAIAKKFKPNGDPDNSFNMTGSAAHLGAGNGSMLHALAVDGDGKVYIAGSNGTEAENKEFMVGAFNSDGEHDPDFTLIDRIEGTTHGELMDMVRLPDGSFVACGYAVGADHTYGVLRKYKTDGSLESSFNASGANFLRHVTDGETRTVAVQSDGKILAAGVYLEDGSNTGIAIARFESDGSPDLSFGTYGYARYDLSDRREFLHDLYVYPDGKILAGGTMNDAVSFDDFLIVKLNSDGSLDESFGTNGYVRKHVGAYGKHNNLNGLTVDSQGRILIAGDGNYNGGSYQNATVMRLLPDGSTDLDFATAGVFNINLTVVNDYFQDVVVGADGSIYAAGHGTVNVGGAVVKLTDAGELSTDFGTDGVFYTDWEAEYISRAYELELQEDGKLLVGCSHEPKDGTPITNSYVYRLLPSGEPDNTFGDNGVLEFYFSSQRGIYGLEIDNAGLIYWSASADADFYLVKIDQNGDALGDPLRVVGLKSRSGVSINKTNGNTYTGAIESGTSGLRVVCIGSSGENEPDCAGVDVPTITIAGDVLTSSIGDSYQWYAAGEPLEGETNQSLIINPVLGGVFSVEVTIGECTLFSDALEYLVTGNLVEEDFRLRVYPNPATENILIEADAELRNATVSLYSVSGKRVHPEKNISGRSSMISLAHLPAGFYILSVSLPAGVQRIKVLKQN